MKLSKVGEFLSDDSEILQLMDDLGVSLDQAVAWIRDQLSGYSCRIHTPEGAIFLSLWFQDLPITSAELYQRLKKQGVFIIASERFFPGLAEAWSHRHECIRVSYAQESSIVRYGIHIIAEEVRLAYNQRKIQTA